MSGGDLDLQTARALHQQGRLPEALAMLDAVLARRPEEVEALLRRGSILSRMNRSEVALASVDRAIAINPKLPEAFLLRGSICGANARFDMSLGAFDQAIAIRPDFADAWFGRGNALAMQRQYADALASYQRALALAPNHADAWAGCGNVLSEMGRSEEAIQAYEKALMIRPEMANALLGRGNLLLGLARHDEALADFDQALRLNPNLAEDWLGQGVIAGRAQRRDDALNAFNRALALNPGLARGWLQAGITLRETGRLAEAFGAITKAVELDPALAEGWAEIGSLELKRKNFPGALAAFAKAAELQPGMPGVAGSCFRVRAEIFDWENFETERESLLAAFKSGSPVLLPFFFAAFFDRPEDQLRCARMWAWPADANPVWKGERYDHPRLRIAYMSADFQEHPVAIQIAGMLGHHDRSRFEITGISLGPKDESELRQRLQAAFDRFVDAAALSDDRIAALVRELEIDILVDLCGSTEGARTRVYAKRAPVQVNYLGYPGTMGTGYHDYIIADRTVIPEHHRPHYSEKVAYLRNSYMPTDDTRDISETQFTRAELGLSPTGFVYCCFNNNYKISPVVFDIWMRILAQVDGSVLWLHERAARAADSLRMQASALGIGPERLVFAERLPRLADHLARHRAADLFIDTVPFNAHTTAVDALWAGLPVLTWQGESFAGRVAASLLHAVGLPELIATTAEQYERRAVELGSDPARLQALKQHLAQSTPLFATERFTRGIEEAFTRMHERHCAGLAPDHIDLSR